MKRITNPKGYRVMKRWANWDNEYAQLVLKTKTREAAEAVAKALYKDQGWLPLTAYTVEEWG